MLNPVQIHAIIANILMCFLNKHHAQITATLPIHGHASSQYTV